MAGAIEWATDQALGGGINISALTAARLSVKLKGSFFDKMTAILGLKKVVFSVNKV
jgi:hypothetical protein